MKRSWRAVGSTKSPLPFLSSLPAKQICSVVVTASVWVAFRIAAVQSPTKPSFVCRTPTRWW
jgi:hypothetical protein